MTVSTVIAALLIATGASCQDDVERPRIPDVFQTEVQGIFIKEKEIVEMDGSLYYDRENNRASFEFTIGADTSRQIYNFNTNEIIAYDGYECTVEAIPDNPQESFFPFTIEKKKKKVVGPETIIFFDQSEFDTQELILLPTLVYKAKIAIPAYEQKNCEVTHFFSKKIELPSCRSTDDCEPTLMTVSVKCKDDDGNLVVDHVYNFYRFIPEIVDKSAAFMPPAGVYCDITSSKDFPSFGSYFSFSYDIVETLKEMDSPNNVFSKHSEVWFERNYKLMRIDEYAENGVLISSRVLDLVLGKSFVIIPIVSNCSVQGNPSDIKFGKLAGLPEFLFSSNDSSASGSVYVGKRKINGLTFEVWSAKWTDSSSVAMVVEEVYFLEIIPDQKMKEAPREPYLKISHIDIYTYQMSGSTQKYELSVLKHITVNNYRIDPKEWSSFDVASCFTHELKRDFYMKVNGTGIIRESDSYLQVIEHLYDKITQVTATWLLRFSELTGVFDGNKLIGVQGSIIDNKEGTGFPSTDPGMDEVFNMIKNAAKQGKLNVTYGLAKEGKLEVLDVLNPAEMVSAEKNTCYSGASMAAASLVLLLIGISFGIAGYYVFLKKRRPASNGTLLKEMEGPNR